MSGTTFSKLPVMIVALVIGLILTFTAVMPLVSDYSEAKTFKNEGYFFMEKVDSGTAMNVVWDYTKPTTLTVNDVDVALPDKDHMSTIPFTIFCSESWYLRYGYDTTYYVGIFQNASNTSYTGTVADTRSITISVSDAGVTTVNNGTEHTWSNATGDFFVISESGDYVMKKMDKDAYVHGDSPIFGYGRTYARSYNYTSELTGTVNDGITGSYYPETTITSAGWTFSDVTLNSVKDENYQDLYKISTMTYEITGEGIQPYTATFSQYIIPAEVTADPDNPAVYKNLVSVLPLFALILLVAGAASLVYFKNKD